MTTKPSTVDWINAAETPPDDDVTVLIALSDGFVWTGYREAGIWRLVTGEPADQADGNTVLYWAEFPPPPQ